MVAAGAGRIILRVRGHWSLSHAPGNVTGLSAIAKKGKMNLGEGHDGGACGGRWGMEDTYVENPQEGKTFFKSTGSLLW